MLRFLFTIQPMKKNQSGYSLVHLLTLLLILTIIGLVAWRIIIARSKTSQESSVIKQANTLAEKETKSCFQNYQLETNTDMNIRFCRPTGWSFDYRAHSDMQLRELHINSPDLKYLGDGGIDTGADVYIGLHKIDDYHLSTKDVLAYIGKNQRGYSDIREVTINGKLGVSFVAGFEKPRKQWTQFDANGMIYFITIGEDMSGNKFNDYTDTYQTIINSIDLIN